jgi:ribosomal protein S18 acetylase RimI-like enzyme
MQVASLGFRTDLALLMLGGSKIEKREDYLVVRTPHNPTFWWGNFLLLPRVPPTAHVDRWLDRFAAEFPGTAHVALGFDGVDGRAESLSAFVDRGLKTEAATVMTASAIHEPPRPNREATYRQLSSDADWVQSVELNALCNHEEEEEVGYRKFAARKVATNRAMVAAGHGAWFGGFLDGQLVSQLGLLSASPGLARFQWVETHPDARGRGLAGTLVHHAAQYGFADLAAETLVMVADPDYLAVRVYRSVGFSDGQTQLQASRPPPIG